MEKYKKIIKTTCIVLIIIIIIIALVILTLKLFSKYIPNEYHTEEEVSAMNNVNAVVQEVSIRNNFYAVKSCIDKFYNYYFESIDYPNKKYIADEEQIKYNKSVLYDMLDKTYIDSKNITKNNLLEKVPNITYSDIHINTMYVSQRTPNVAIYFVYGYFNDRVNNKQKDFYNVVKVDMLNKTFDMILEDLAEQQYGNVKVGDNIQVEEFTRIEKRENNNVFEYEIISDEKYAKDIFDEYKQNLIYNKPLAYEQLDKEYKEKRFPTYEIFEEYLRQNGKRTVLMEIVKYQKNVFDNYTQYVGVDNTGRYYILNMKNVSSYGAILDMHSVEIPQFTEKYKEAGEIKKLEMNLDKIFDAINDKDYRYLYNKLDETFKQNNFPNVEDLEKYMKNNFFTNNSLQSSSYDKKDGIYICNVQVKNGDNQEEGTEKEFIMQLKEGTDFVVSFNVE